MHHEDSKNTKGIMNFDNLSSDVIGCTIEVHRELGSPAMITTLRKCLSEYEVLE